MQKPNRSDKLALASGYTLFENLSEACLQTLTETAEVRSFEAGDVLWEAGDPTCCVSFLTDGTLKLVTARRDGREIILDLRHPGDCVGYEALGDAESRRSRTAAVTDTRLLQFERERLLSVLERHPPVMEVFVRDLVRSRSALVERLRQLCTAGAERRLAMVFDRLADDIGVSRTFENDVDGVWIPLSLSRSDLAELINTRIETAIRLMSDWRSADIVQTESDGFAINDPDHLRVLAHDE